LKSAYVTGASQGIGKEFVRVLSKRLNVFLISRTSSDLSKVIQEIQPDSIGILKAIPLDLSKKEDRGKLYEIIENDPDLEILVNNAGFGTIGLFADNHLKAELEEIHVNVKAVVELSHAALKNLKKQKTGSLINVASIAGFLPAPGSAIYAASKAFVKSFTESLHEEMKPFGVKVQALCPGLTHSAFHERAGINKNKYPKFLWQSSDEVVNASLESLERNEAVCITGLVNQTAITFTEFMPRAIIRKLAGSVKLQD